ncbi:probable pectinesterase 53 isoform X1 [Aegilops tauschii subsp. strangulata]|uniref:probable pectinesterase 53 isoform X1 n=1 Tax=Aegilops tauschii subsp. strangulata TaxID=200361 RepID=UPI00098A0C7B|nr:probable pectinesterase 53 isoform X1 [Aegilops tauschii subsp. strangulata]
MPPMPRAGRLLLCVATVAAVASGVDGHTRGVRPGRAAGRPFPENATRAEELERLFMRWVRYVGGLKHSTFHHAPLARAFPSYSLVVDKDPAAGDFTSVQAAVDSLPTINLVRVVIKVNAGTYTEKVTISSMRAFITLEGAGADKTIVQWGDTADTPAGPRGRPLGTYGSASFAVNAQYFIARNITFKVRNSPSPPLSPLLGASCPNTRLRWQNTAPVPPAGATGKQAVALRVSADNAAFVGCRFLGAQDTLYDQSGRHYYKDCYIEGSIDFIFGNALSLYEGCHVHAIARDYGALTAQNRQSMLEDTGFSFVGCRVTGSGALYLGRAWGTFSRVVFAYTYMDDIIVPRGWYNWGDPSRELTVFYGQYKCTGPGASYSGRVSWSRELTDEEAKPFISLSFIDGTEWIRI